MHFFIDDLVWVAIGLVVVAFLFMLGAAYIFLDEGIRRLFRSHRKPATVTVPNLATQVVRTPNQMSRYKPLVPPQSGTHTGLWRKMRLRVRGIRPADHLHLHLGRHKPANAKP